MDIDAYINDVVKNSSNNNIKLDLSGYKLKNLPKLPNNLKYLDCSKNELTELNNLPDSLEYLICSNNKLTALPNNLPDTLKFIACDFNNIIYLPKKMPNDLVEFFFSNNYIKKLPEFSNKLTKLIFINNLITEITNLPNNLIELNGENNKIKTIDYLPESLKIFNCVKNQLTSLPNIPENITQIYIDNINIFKREQIEILKKKYISIYDSNGKKLNISDYQEPFYDENIIVKNKKNEVYDKLIDEKVLKSKIHNDVVKNIIVPMSQQSCCDIIDDKTHKCGNNYEFTNNKIKYCIEHIDNWILSLFYTKYLTTFYPNNSYDRPVLDARSMLSFVEIIFESDKIESQYYFYTDNKIFLEVSITKIDKKYKNYSKFISSNDSNRYSMLIQRSADTQFSKKRSYIFDDDLKKIKISQIIIYLDTFYDDKFKVKLDTPEGIFSSSNWNMTEKLKSMYGYDKPFLYKIIYKNEDL